MYSFKIILFAAFLVLDSAVFSVAQSGARFAALGAKGAALQGLWTAGANPAAIAAIEHGIAGIDYTTVLVTPAIVTKQAAVAVPIGKYRVGTDITEYGLDEYHEQGFRFACAGTFGQDLRIGIGLNYHMLQIKHYGNATTWSVNAGIQYKYGNRLVAGVFVSNPAGNAYSGTIRAEVPVNLGLGVSYKISPNVLLNADIFGDRGGGVESSAGLEYEPSELISFRGGIAVNPFSRHAGIGFHYKSILIDAALSFNELSGNAPQISLSYGF